MFTGGLIEVNGITDYHIDVKQLSGFAPNGEFISTTSDYYDLSLSDETLGVVNFVLAIYTENEIHHQPHESNGERYPTEASAAWRIRIYTEAEYDALPDTDANLANDAKDRSLLIGKVTANGPLTTLTASSIESPTEFAGVLYANPREFVTIPGIQIIGVSPDTQLGDGTIEYTYTAGPNYTFTWESAAGGGPGLPVPVAADGVYDLQDSTGAYIKILVGLSLLPTTGTFPISVTTTIYNLYHQDVPRQTAEDWLHRNFIGSGTPTPNNPHGLSLNDILEDEFTLLEEHQDIEHCNGIWKGSNAGCLATSVQPSTPVNSVDITAPTVGDIYYVNGQKHTAIDVTNISFTTPADLTTYFYEIYVSDEGSVEYLQKAAYPNAPRTCTGTWIVDMSRDYPAGGPSYNLDVVGTASDYTFTWDNGNPVTVEILTNSSQVIRLYAEDGAHWIDLYINLTPGVGDDHLPGVGSFTDAITVIASLDLGEHIQIASTPYWYDGASWIIGYPPDSISRFLVDKRPWGTLCTVNMADSALEEISYDPANELGGSGVLLRRNGYNNEFRLSNASASAFTADMNGGSYYSRGKRVTVDSVSSLAFSPTSVSLVWASWDGVVYVTNVTSTFGGNVTNAMRWIMGSMVNTPPNTAIYHADDQIDSPERGVLLWYVETDGSGVTYECDFSKNVNQVEHPWSISGRSATYAAQAAFDSLFTAFEYAKSYALRDPFKTGSIQMQIIGTTDIDREITQPPNVDSVSTRGTASTQAVVNVTNANVGGSWHLSQGNQISRLTFLNSGDGGSIFSLADDVVIEGCYYDVDPAVVTDGFISLYNGSGISRVRIRDNYIITNSGLFLNVVPHASGYFDFEIMGNTIAVTAGTTTSAIYMQSAAFAKIERNFIVVPDTDDNPVAGVWVQTDGGAVYTTNNVAVKDNVIFVDNFNPTQAQPSYGVVLNKVNEGWISGNRLRSNVTSATQIAVGAWVRNSSRISVFANFFEECGIGVYVGDSFYDVEVYNNQLTRCFHKGVYVEVTTYPAGNSVYGLRVEDNMLTGFLKGNVGTTGWSADLNGVEIDLTSLITADSSVHNISVSRNTMHGLISSVNRVNGIYLDIDTNADTVAKNFSFDGNKMSDFSTSTGNMRGVYLAGSASISDYAPKVVSVSENHMFFDVDDTVNRQAGIEIHCYLRDSVINDNDILIQSANEDSNGNGIDIGRGSTTRRSRDLLISGNKIKVLVAGMYLRLQDSLVSGNKLYSTSVGAFLNLSNSTFDGNHVRVLGYSDNPYTGAGSQCICTASNSVFADNIVISNCHCFLEGYSGSNLLRDKSACIRVRNIFNFEVIGCKTWIDVRALVSGEAEHIYASIPGNSGSGICHFAIKDCTCDNTVDTPVCSSIRIARDSSFDETSLTGDIVRGQVHGNTIYGAVTGSVTQSNAVDPAAFPYELVQDVVNDGPVPSIVYTGNSILLDNAAIGSFPAVYTSEGDVYNGTNLAWPAVWW
jgi:hypothetical protein